MLASVIIPIYNLEKELSRSLDSVLQQERDDFELLLINDGSTDQSGFICDEYARKDVRIKVFHQNNRGVSQARNKGLKEAKGKWIAFVDGDDYVEPDFLSLLDRSDLREADLIKFSYSKTDKITTDPCNLLDEKWISNTDFFSHQYYVSCVWAFFFKREHLEKERILFSTDLVCSEDREFLAKYILSSRKIFFSKEVLYHYCIRAEESASQKKRNYFHCKDDLRVLQRVEEFVETKKYTFPKHAQTFFYELQYYSFIWALAWALNEETKYSCIRRDFRIAYKKHARLPYRRNKKLLFQVFFTSPSTALYLLKMREKINAQK